MGPAVFVVGRRSWNMEHASSAARRMRYTYTVHVQCLLGLVEAVLV